MSSKQVTLGAIISYLAIAINIISGLLFTPWMIRSIGKENFGLYTLAISVITLFVFDFGLSSAVTRFIARYLAQGRQDKANNCLGLVYRLYIIIDIILFIVLLIVFFFIPYIYQELTPDEIEKFKVVYSMAAFYTIVSLPFIPVNGILTAHECFIQLKVCDILHKLIIVGTMTVCLLLDYGLYALVLVNALSGILIIFIKLWCIRRYTKQKISWNYFNIKELKELASYSGWVTVIALSQRCIFSLAPSILGILSGSTSIAIFGIAMTIEGYTYTFANALNGMFLPRVSRIVNDHGDILPLMIQIGRIQIFIVGLIVGGVICLGQDFICLWVGNEFRDSYLCSVLIVLPSFLHLPQMIGSETIYAKNKVKKLAVVYIYMALSNLVGAVLLVRPFGAFGICLSVCIAYFVRTVGMDVIFYRDLKLDILLFFKESFLKISIPFALTILSGIFMAHFISDLAWSVFIIKCALYVLIYVMIMYLFAINKREKDLVLVLLKRLMRV